MSNSKKVLVAGAGGFIGHHLVKYLKSKGYWIRGVDIKRPEYEQTLADEFLLLDLREKVNTLKATKEMEYVYNLAANMGGIGFIESVHAQLMHDNVLIDTNMLEASFRNGVKKFFYSSSALIYPNFIERSKKNTEFKEEDAYPAKPDSEYGWEKLFIERLCADYYTDYGFETRVARFHNVYGPLGTWQGGRERSWAAICRKVAIAEEGGEIEVWGDGKQTRSYCFIRDCILGIYKLMMSDCRSPVNVGSNRLVTIDQMVSIVSNIANKKVRIRHNLTKPQGVRGRNSDNTLIRRLFKWEPSTPLEGGLRETYEWIKKQIDEGKLLSNE